MRKLITLLTLLLLGFEQILAQEGGGIADVGGNVGDNVGETFTNIFEIVSPSKIISVIVVLILLSFTLKALDWFFNWASKKFNRHRLKILRVQPIINVLLWVITIVTLVRTLFDPTPETLFALFTSSAIALGFAAQDILKNIFGGVLILFDRPFQIGDRIRVKENYGEVKHIGLRNTQINTLDDSIVTIPNATIISDSVSNANNGALECMVVIDLWLPVNINVIKVRRVAYESTVTSKYVNFDRPILILFKDHFDNRPATNVIIKAYVMDARFEKAFAGDVTETAKKAFNEMGFYEKFYPVPA